MNPHGVVHQTLTIKQVKHLINAYFFMMILLACYFFEDSEPRCNSFDWSPQCRLVSWTCDNIFIIIDGIDFSLQPSRR